MAIQLHHAGIAQVLAKDQNSQISARRAHAFDDAQGRGPRSRGADFLLPASSTAINSEYRLANARLRKKNIENAKSHIVS